MMRREELLAHYARVRAHYRALAPAYSREANQTCEGRYRDLVQRVMSGPNVVSFRELIREVPVATHVRDLASMIVMATHPEWDRSPEPARRFVRYGASPRGAQALILGAKVRALAEGRYNVSVDDLKALTAPALRHRIILNFEGEAEAVDVDMLIAEIVQSAEALVAQGKESFLR